MLTVMNELFLLNVVMLSIINWMSLCRVQGILKGKVSLYSWAPV